MNTDHCFQHDFGSYIITGTLKLAKLQLTVILAYAPPIRFAASLDFHHDSHSFMVFPSIQELFKLLKSSQNSSFDWNTNQLVVKWKTVAYDYERQHQGKINFEVEKLSQIESLKIENKLLKKRLENYETLSLNDQKIRDTEEENKQYDSERTKVVNETETKSNQGEKNSTPSKNNKKSFEKNNQKYQNVKRMQKVKVQKREDIQQKKAKKNGRKKKMVHQYTDAIQTQQSSKLSQGKIRISFQNGDFYYGETKNNVYHGHGLYFSVSNGSFEGQWQNGQANGYGISKDLAGNQHKGYYINDKRTGKGIDIYMNGERYDGQFQEDAKSGKGKYWYSNGDIYEGQWKNDLYNGFGKEIYKDGSIYQGIWAYDEKNGSGVLTDKSNRKWKQFWEKGVMLSEKQLQQIA